MDDYGENSERLVDAINDAMLDVLDQNHEKYRAGMISCVCDGASVNMGHWTGDINLFFTYLL